MRKNVLLAVSGLLLLASGVAIGRYTLPPKMVVTEKVKIVETQVVVTQTKTEVKVVTVKDSAKSTSTQERIEQKPDGTVITTKNTQETEKTNESSGTEIKNEGSTVAINQKIEEKEKIKIVENRPNWAIGLNGGYNLSNISGPPVLQLSIDRRIVGPIMGGIIISNKGFVGIGIKVEF